MLVTGSVSVDLWVDWDRYHDYRIAEFRHPSVDDKLSTLVPADFSPTLFALCLRFSVN